MQKTLSMVLALALLAGCSWIRRSDSGAAENKTGGSDSFTTPPQALPGFPLGSVRPHVPAKARAAAPAGAPVAAPAAPADDLPAATASSGVGAAELKQPAAAADPGDLTFHIAAADNYSARKKYRSAGAEYGAALRYLPDGDARAVHLLERQGAMLLKAGAAPKAKEYFLSAIKKAEELHAEGNDLADAQLGLGYCFEKENKLPEAISSYKKAMELTSSKAVKAKLSKTISDLKK